MKSIQMLYENLVRFKKNKNQGKGKSKNIKGSKNRNQF